MDEAKELKLMTFIMACRTYFGLKPSQTLQEFAAEIRELNEADRKYLIELFKTIGIDATKVS